MNQIDPSNINDLKAQNGEDKVLLLDFCDKKSGFCVEVGAYNGIDMSNTFFFEKLGWKCLLVEADPEMAKLCQRNRPEAIVVNCAAVSPGSPSQVRFQIAEDVKAMSSIALDDNSRRRITGYSGKLAIHEITIPARTLDSILEESKFIAIDFISIDVEGHELDVLKGFDIMRWKPRVVLVERCRIYPVWDILRYFDKGGYALIRRTGDNDWYYQAQHSSGIWKLFICFYCLPLPRLLPKMIAQGFKNILFKLGIYKRILQMLRK